MVERRSALGTLRTGWLDRRRRWLHWVNQFLLGGLMSAYVVFYVRSAGSLRAVPFVVGLVALMFANEYLEAWLRTELVRLGLFFFCTLTFLLFLIPVLTGSLGWWVPVVSAMLSGLLLLLVTTAIHLGSRDLVLSVGMSAAMAAGMSAFLLLLSWLQLIPPVPLSVEHAGIYHQVERGDDGYLLTWRAQPWYTPWRDHEAVFLRQEGDAAWCFSSVFAPTGMALSVRHRWQRFDEMAGEWRTSDTIAYPMRGGRDGGYRGFTHKSKLTDGRWRVIVETVEGRELGRIGFLVRPMPEGEPARWRTTVWR